MPHVIDEPLSIEEAEKRRKKRRKALKKRLKSLPQDNPIVKAALDQKDEINKRDDKHDKWEIVENLQFTAYNEFFDEGMSFKEAVNGLGEALKALVS